MWVVRKPWSFDLFFYLLGIHIRFDGLWFGLVVLTLMHYVYELGGWQLGVIRSMATITTICARL